MRKMVLTLAGLALVASPAFAGKYNKVVSVGDKAPTFSGIPAATGRPGHQPEPQRHQGRRGRPGLPRQPLPRRHRRTTTASSTSPTTTRARASRSSASPSQRHGVDRLPGIKKHIKEKGIPYVYGYDETQAIGKAYGATNTPQFFVLDKDRVIRYTGAMDDSPSNEAKVTKTYLRDAVDALLAGDSPEVTETRPVGCGI